MERLAPTGWSVDGRRPSCNQQTPTASRLSQRRGCGGDSAPCSQCLECPHAWFGRQLISSPLNRPPSPQPPPSYPSRCPEQGKHACLPLLLLVVPGGGWQLVGAGSMDLDLWTTTSETPGGKNDQSTGGETLGGMVRGQNQALPSLVRVPISLSPCWVFPWPLFGCLGGAASHSIPRVRA